MPNNMGIISGGNNHVMDIEYHSGDGGNMNIMNDNTFDTSRVGMRGMDLYNNNNNIIDDHNNTRIRSTGDFPTTKASTSCRFFNTRTGCRFGDKCPFGHFLEPGSVISSSLNGPPPRDRGMISDNERGSRMGGGRRGRGQKR